MGETPFSPLALVGCHEGSLGRGGAWQGLQDHPWDRRGLCASQESHIWGTQAGPHILESASQMLCSRAWRRRSCGSTEAGGHRSAGSGCQVRGQQESGRGGCSRVMRDVGAGDWPLGDQGSGRAALRAWSQRQPAGPLTLCPLPPAPRLKSSRPSRNCSRWRVPGRPR